MTSLAFRFDGQGEHPLAAAERLFRRMAGDRLDLLSTAWVRMDASRQFAEALGDIRSVAHKIAGTADSLGHSDLGALAAKVERLCLEGAGRDDLQRALRPLISALAELTDE
jgi:HPt (histidine-containing phosphotransfer) domain-containing protein